MKKKNTYRRGVTLLRLARYDRGLNLPDVAPSVGVSAPTLGGIECGRDPRLSTARLLSEFYKKTIDELFPRLA